MIVHSTSETDSEIQIQIYLFNKACHIYTLPFGQILAEIFICKSIMSNIVYTVVTYFYANHKSNKKNSISVLNFSFSFFFILSKTIVGDTHFKPHMQKGGKTPLNSKAQARLA